MNQFIDIHTHVLYGLDDGPENMQESFALCRCYVNAGIKTVIATPHYLPGTAWAPSSEKILKTIEALQQGLNKANIDVTVKSGMEIAFHKKMAERILSGELLPLAGSKYFLVEPSFQGQQGSLFASLESLLKQGVKVILAHPERIDVFQQKPEFLERLVKLGGLVQVNAGSLLGYFGRRSRETAQILRATGCLHFIASDAHDTEKRTPLSHEEWTALGDIRGGKEMLDICVKNSQKFYI